MPRPHRKNGRKRGKVGRPTLFTPPVETRLLKGARDGATRTENAVRSGIAYGTLSDWLALGEGREAEGEQKAVPPDPMFAAFAMRYAQAEEAYFSALERVVHSSAKKNGEVALSILARRRPQKWAHKTQVRFGEQDGKQPVFTLSFSGSEDLDSAETKK